MIIGAISDLHLVGKTPECRLDNIVELQWGKLRWVFNKCEELGCSVLLQAGDLTDNARSWYVLPTLAALLSENWNFKFYGVYGQHDTYMYSEQTRDRTNLGVLAMTKRARILSPRPVLYNGVRFYGASWGQEVPKPRDRRKTNVLVTHAPIGPAVYPGHETTSAGRFLRKHDRFDFILCGDVHRSFFKKSSGRSIVNTGPLVRKWADRATRKHTPNFVVWDSDTGNTRRFIIPHGNAQEVISTDHLEREDQTDNTDLINEFVAAMDEYEDPEVNTTVMLREVMDRMNISAEAREVIALYMEGEEHAIDTDARRAASATSGTNGTRRRIRRTARKPSRRT